MSRKAIFPGSFDPITKGHESIVLRALPLFDEIVIGIGLNAEKKEFFSLEKRVGWIKEIFANYPTISVKTYACLTVDFCQQENATYIIRGLRTSADFEFERSIGQVNKRMHPDIETLFLLTSPELTAINSSIVRDIIKHQGDPTPFIPEKIAYHFQ